MFSEGTFQEKKVLGAVHDITSLEIAVYVTGEGKKREQSLITFFFFYFFKVFDVEIIVDLCKGGQSQM